MFWVHAQRFTRRNAKEERVKLVGIPNKRSLTHIHFAGDGALRVIIRIHIPAVTRHPLHQIRPITQQLPEGFRRVCAREATGHADHRNRQRAQRFNGSFTSSPTNFLAFGSGLGAGPGQRQHVSQQVGGQLINRGIFKGDGRGQRLGETPFQPAAQFQRHQRIEPQIGKAGGRVRQIGHPQHVADGLLQIAAQLILAPTER